MFEIGDLVHHIYDTSNATFCITAFGGSEEVRWYRIESVPHPDSQEDSSHSSDIYDGISGKHLYPVDSSSKGKSPSFFGGRLPPFTILLRKMRSVRKLAKEGYNSGIFLEENEILPMDLDAEADLNSLLECCANSTEKRRLLSSFIKKTPQFKVRRCPITDKIILFNSLFNYKLYELYEDGNRKGHYSAEEYLTWFPRGRGYVTEGIVNDIGRDSIKRYNFRAEVIGFRVDNKDPKNIDPETQLYLGVELELSFKEDWKWSTAFHLSEDFSDFLILKNDSSISNGLELNSCPATLSVQRKEWSRIFDGYLNDFRNDPSCGMHVHINRLSLSPLTLGKMISFLNQSKNRLFLSTIAGRRAHSLSEWSSMKYDSKPTDVLKRDQERYRALNLTNDNTVEIRIFASTTKAEIFFARLEFCVGLVDFCREVSLQDICVPSFLKYMAQKEKRGQFPAFYKWAVNKNLITSKTSTLEYRDRIAVKKGR